MILFLANGKQIRGDLIRSAVIRSDLAPVPLTMEAEIRTDDDLLKQLAEGGALTLASGDVLRILKQEPSPSRQAQGMREMAGVKITAMLEACHTLAFVRERAIVKEGTSLAAIYRAAGAKISGIEADFPVPRFTCPVGDTPSFSVARVLQEEGGVVRWKNGKLHFFRLSDLFKQKPILTLPENIGGDVESGFLARHEVPSFFSVAPNGSVLLGARTKARTVQFSPHKDAQRLRNMSRCLIVAKTPKINLAGQVAAGDLVQIVGGMPLVVITAAHVFESGTDGDGSNQYTKLWLGRLEE